MVQLPCRILSNVSACHHDNGGMCYESKANVFKHARRTLQPETGLFQESEVVRSPGAAHHHQNVKGCETDDQLRFDGMPFLLARIVASLVFGRAFNGVFAHIQHDGRNAFVEERFFARQAKDLHQDIQVAVVHLAGRRLTDAEHRASFSKRGILPEIHKREQELFGEGQRGGFLATATQRLSATFFIKVRPNRHIESTNVSTTDTDSTAECYAVTGREDVKI